MERHRWRGGMCQSSSSPPCPCLSLCSLPLIAVSQRERQTLLTRWWHQKVPSDSLSLTGLLCLNTLLVPAPLHSALFSSVRKSEESLGEERGCLCSWRPTLGMLYNMIIASPLGCAGCENTTGMRWNAAFCARFKSNSMQDLCYSLRFVFIGN